MDTLKKSDNADIEKFYESDSKHFTDDMLIWECLYYCIFPWPLFDSIIKMP